MNRRRPGRAVHVIAAALAAGCAAAGGVLRHGAALAAEPKTAFVFRDAGDESGVLPHAAGIRGHAAGWGDVDGDGWLDLYVGTFFEQGSKPNLLLRNERGKFRPDAQPAAALQTRSNAALFADLDNDGDADLYVSAMPKPDRNLRGCSLLRNDGGGKFADVSADNGACPPDFGGRSAAVLDYDGDGLLDLLVGEDPLPGYNGSPTKSSRLFRNLGGLRFEDASRAAGIPADVPGLGVAAGDLNGDGWPDCFLASHFGGNVLLLNDGKGRFREPAGAREAFAWPDAGPGDNMIAGVCFGDVNRDGRPDVVIGQHFKTPWVKPVPIRLYLNRGNGDDGSPKFEDVTAAAGLGPLPIKAPHVEVQDFDNDGWPDVYASVVKFAGNEPFPLIYKNLGGGVGGEPRFREDVMAVNDFPTDEDRAVRRTGEFFDKVVREGKVMYTAPGPSADYDNDGRLDLFLANWFPESRSLLLRNETPGGQWLQVQVKAGGGKGVNAMGVGSRVSVYEAGKLGQAAALLGCREIAIGYGYVSGQPPVAHFGLGERGKVDVEVVLPHGKGRVVREGVAADQRVTIEF